MTARSKSLQAGHRVSVRLPKGSSGSYTQDASITLAAGDTLTITTTAAPPQPPPPVVPPPSSDIPQPPTMVAGEWRKNFADGTLAPFKVRPTLIHSGDMVRFNDLATRPQVTVHDGYADIRCTPKDATLAKWDGSLIATSQDGDGPTFGYGRFEALTRANIGYATWQSFWLLVTGPNPNPGYTGYEIDVLEILEKGQQSFHVLGLGTLPTKYIPSPVDWATVWHKLWAEKRSDGVTFGLDDTTHLVVKAPQPATPQAMIAQSVVGHPWEGAPDARTPNPTWLQLAWARFIPAAA